MSDIIMGKANNADRRLRCFEMATDFMGVPRGHADLVKTLHFAALIAEFVNQDVLPAQKAEAEAPAPAPAPGTGWCRCQPRQSA